MKALHLIILLASPLLADAVARNEMGDVLKKNENLEMLSNLFEVDPTLFDASQDPVDTTFLAPSNEAFRRFLKNNRGGDYMTNKATRFRVFKDLMNYHTLRGIYKVPEIFEENEFPRTAMQNISFKNLGGKTQVVRAVKTGESGLLYGGFNEPVSIIDPNLVLWNGYMHVVDRFLRVPGTVSATATELGLGSWVNATKNAKLEKILNELANSTVFIPASHADTALFNGNTHPLKLTDILQAHVVKGQVLYSNDLKLKVVELTTMNDKTLHITVRGGHVYVNGARIVSPDCLTMTGVIHVVDGVLDPRGPTFKKANGKVDCKCNGQGCVSSKGISCETVAVQKGSTQKPEEDSARRLAVNYGLVAVIMAIAFALAT